MKRLAYTSILIILSFVYCSKKSPTFTSHEDQDPEEFGCPSSIYNNWETSSYVLPYPVGSTYKVNLSHCTSSYHAEGQPDQFGIDFDMPVGSLITATRAGIVVHVVESGVDGGFPNNLVVVQHDDLTFGQYMHLTKNGALVEVGDEVEKGSSLGHSGFTGLAGYPHLHFIITRNSWEYPYEGIPYNFKNTKPNPKSLIMGQRYTANQY